MQQANWIWMPHPGHFIAAENCKFSLNTYVGGYVVSTVGELFWENRDIQEIYAGVKDSEWLDKNRHLKGDLFKYAYKAKFGFDDIGLDRKYETMVFKARRSEHKCCPWVMVSGREVAMMGYNKPEDAVRGHLAMCKKWAAKR